MLDLLGQLVLDLLGKITRHCGKRTQIVLDILVAAEVVLAVDGYAIWRTVHHYRQGEFLFAGIFALVVVLSLLLVGFVIVRRIILNRGKKNEP